MIPNVFLPKRVIFFVVCLVLVVLASAQTTAKQTLGKELEAMDSALFETFNTCNLVKNEIFFTEDLEFYHDKGGLTVSRKKLTESLQGMCNNTEKTRRELVKGSLKVYSLKNYALQFGVHSFFQRMPGQEEKAGSIARFIHLWNYKNGEWRISRVLSYDHRLPHSNDPEATEELYNKIGSLDSTLFVSVNSCNAEKSRPFLSADFEFYDDRSGLNRDKELTGFKNRCGDAFKLRRELVKGSQSVYPLANYGAIELGEHRIYITEKGKKEKLTEIAKFIYVWHEKDGKWTIERAFSYDRKSL